MRGSKTGANGESLEIVLQAWTKGKVNFYGEHFHYHAALEEKRAKAA